MDKIKQIFAAFAENKDIDNALGNFTDKASDALINKLEKIITQDGSECGCCRPSMNTYTTTEYISSSLLYGGHYHCGAVKALRDRKQVGFIHTWSGGKITATEMLDYRDKAIKQEWKITHISFVNGTNQGKICE